MSYQSKLLILLAIIKKFDSLNIKSIEIVDGDIAEIWNYKEVLNGMIWDDKVGLE